MQLYIFIYFISLQSVYSYYENYNQYRGQHAQLEQLKNVVETVQSVRDSYDKYQQETTQFRSDSLHSSSKALNLLLQQCDPEEPLMMNSLFGKADQTILTKWFDLINHDFLRSNWADEFEGSDSHSSFEKKIQQLTALMNDELLDRHEQRLTDGFNDANDTIKILSNNFKFIHIGESSQKNDDNMESQFLIAEKGVHTLILQTNDCPVLYTVSQDPLWRLDSDHYGGPAHYHAIMQVGNNLAIYDSRTSLWMLQITDETKGPYFIVIENVRDNARIKKYSLKNNTKLQISARLNFEDFDENAEFFAGKIRDDYYDIKERTFC